MVGKICCPPLGRADDQLSPEASLDLLQPFPAENQCSEEPTATGDEMRDFFLLKKKSVNISF